MHRPRSSVSTLPENLIFDNDSTSSDAGVDSPIPWNTMPIPAQNPLTDYRILSSGAHSQYPQHARRDVRIAEWCSGETSSSARQYEPYDILSPDNVQINLNGNQTTNGPFLLQNSSSSNATCPQDLNMSLEFEDQEDDDDCRVIERPTSRISIGSSNQVRPNAGYAIGESEDRPVCSLDGRRVSCKRKSLEAHGGPSSGGGSSNFFQNNEQRQWHTIPENNISIPVPTENNNVVNNNGPEHNHNGLRLGVGRAFSSSPFSSTPHGNPESSRRNFRLRINGLHQQDPILPENPFSSPADVGNVEVSSSRHSSRLALRNRLLDLNPSPAVENGSGLHGQSSLLDVPSARRNHQSRWSSGPSSARSSRSFGTTAVSDALYEELAQRTFPRRVSEHPMFVPASEPGNSSQNPTNWNFSSEGHTNSNNNNNNNAGNVASTSRVGSTRGESSSTPSWAHRSFPQYPRRLSEIVRRSLLLSDRSVNNNNVVQSGSTQETTPSAGTDDNLGRHVPTSSRSALLERNVDGASGIPYSWRTLASASEGRNSVMSEIRHVLDLMRRGEGLRFEDVMVLDHSVLFGMADVHDRHRDMRLDVDNMSYEELLALEERIGNVCTGLTEENILSGLKERRFFESKVDHVETEPCSICREEYNDGEYLGTLECGHDFHKECIKQWLVQKNLCPICKTTGLTT